MTDQSPAGLAARGAAFWERVTGAFEIEADERELLAEVCRTLDLVDALQAVLSVEGPLSVGSTGQPVAHPAGQELRAHRLVLSRLLAQLGLPDGDGKAVPSGVQVRGRAAAQKRWANHVPSGGRRGA